MKVIKEYELLDNIFNVKLSFDPSNRPGGVEVRRRQEKLREARANFRTSKDRSGGIAFIHNGRDLTGNTPWRRVRNGVAEYYTCHPDLTPFVRPFYRNEVKYEKSCKKAILQDTFVANQTKAVKAVERYSNLKEFAAYHQFQGFDHFKKSSEFMTHLARENRV